MSRITKYLNQLITGNVFDAPNILEAYATDRSILKITPHLVALPESTTDLIKLLKFFSQLAKRGIKVPISIRSSGLDEMGASLSTGLVISTEKLNRLLEISPRDRLVRVQAGITLKELNTALSVSGLTIPIDANENETIGGLISGAPIDDFQKQYDGIASFVEHTEVILANGECIQTELKTKHQIKKLSDRSLESKIYQRLSQLLVTKGNLVKKLQAAPTDFAGYSTIAFVEQKRTLDLTPLFFGAEGTLGLISEVILRAVPIEKPSLKLLSTFPDFKSTLSFLGQVKALKPLKLNLYSLDILKSAALAGKNLSPIIKNFNTGYVVFAQFNRKVNSIARKLRRLSKKLPKASAPILSSKDNQLLFAEFQNSLTSFFNLPTSGERPALLTNFSVPETQIANFLSALPDLEAKLKRKLPLFGSFNNGIYNFRPQFDLATDQKTMLRFLQLGAELISSHGGSVTGGGPEGRVKALVAYRHFSSGQKQLHRDIKTIFDPNNILNPNIKLGTNARFVVNHLRTSDPDKIVL